MSQRRALSAAYLERKLRAVTGVQGGNPLPELEDLNGLITLESDRPEWGLAANDLTFSHYIFLAAGGVGNATVIGWRNTPVSGSLVIIERAWARVDPAGAAVGVIEIAYTFASITARNRNARDQRVQTTFSSGDPSPVADNTLTLATLNLQTISVFNPEVESYTKPIIIGLPTASQGQVAVVMSGLDNTGARRTNVAMHGGFDVRIRPFEGTLEIR